MAEKILYVPRIVFGRKNNFFKRLKKSFRERKFSGQEGFFEASLYYGFDVSETSLFQLEKKIKKINAKYDAVVVDWQNGRGGGLAAFSDLKFIKKLDVPVVLFCGNAVAGVLPCNDILDLFSVVFKREPYKDRDRYSISASNKRKIYPTMLACKAVSFNRKNIFQIQIADYGSEVYGPKWQSDVFFLGQVTHQGRIDLIRTVKELGVNFSGGLYPLSKRTQQQQDYIIPGTAYQDVHHLKIDSDLYLSKMIDSRINLCPAGFGEFTFRHQEAWLYNCFVLSESTIDLLDLPIRVKAYEHYVPYENLEDLKEKVRFYLDDDVERKKIADRGREQFIEDYSLEKHSASIRKAVFGSGLE